MVATKTVDESNLRMEKAKRFMLAFQDCVRETNGDRTKIHQFIQANLAELDDDFLAVLPQVFTSLIAEKTPEDVAVLFFDFGYNLVEFPLGSRSLNLELCIAVFQLDLEVYQRKTLPNQWAMTQNNLANAYLERIKGDRAENIEQAITAYQLALEVRQRDAFPEKWAMTQHNLANAYSNRINGDRAENIEQAITACQGALEVRQRDAFPEDWAITQNNLAIAYKNRIKGDQVENIKQAITAYQRALEVYQREAFPEDWAMTQNNLAIAYVDRIKGDQLVRDGQWQEGLSLLLNSVNLFSKSDNQLAHANALFQTGRAHETLADWEKAQLYYRDALRLYRHLDDALGCAKSGLGLGSVLVFQGHLQKGMTELATARDLYTTLDQTARAADADKIYQAAQRALAGQAVEVPV
jgi:tetratricopeptide (TPR) repeat protein